MELDAFNVIKGPMITEKVTDQTERSNVYGFRVDMHANKVQIRQAVERIWGVDVVEVRTQVRKGKPRRFRWAWGKQASWKLAMVKLAEGQRIES